MSRHRGAKPPRRYGRLEAISLFMLFRLNRNDKSAISCCTDYIFIPIKSGVRRVIKVINFLVNVTRNNFYLSSMNGTSVDTGSTVICFLLSVVRYSFTGCLFVSLINCKLIDQIPNTENREPITEDFPRYYPLPPSIMEKTKTKARGLHRY